MLLAVKAKNKLKKGGEDKMRQVFSILLVLGLAMCCISLAEAQTSTTVSATATVPEELILRVSLNRVNSMGTDDNGVDDVWDPTPATSMTFGRLTHTLDNGTEAGTLFSKPYYYVALMGAYSSGRRYYIRSSCSGLVGPVTLTKGFGVTFIDNNPKKADGSPINTGTFPSGAVLGTPGPAVVSDKLLLDSGSTGANWVIGAYFGIPPYKADGSIPYPGFQPIPLSAPNGDYTGEVRFTLTL